VVQAAKKAHKSRSRPVKGNLPSNCHHHKRIRASGAITFPHAHKSSANEQLVTRTGLLNDSSQNPRGNKAGGSVIVSTNSQKRCPGNTSAHSSLSYLFSIDTDKSSKRSKRVRVCQTSTTPTQLVNRCSGSPAARANNIRRSQASHKGRKRASATPGRLTQGDSNSFKKRQGRAAGAPS